MNASLLSERGCGIVQDIDDFNVDDIMRYIGSEREVGMEWEDGRAYVKKAIDEMI